MSITITKEGALRLHEFLTQQNGEFDPGMSAEFLLALSDAAAGDFTALAELAGEAKVVDAVCSSCDGSGSIPSAIGKAPHKCVPCSGTGAFTRPSSASVAPAPAPDFREGDVVTYRNASHDVLGVRANGELTIRETGPTQITHFRLSPALCTLTHRRHFRAGERCPVVALDQVRIDSDGGPYIVTSVYGNVVSAEWRDDHGPGVTGSISDFASDPLAAPYSAPEAVEMKP